MSKNEKMRVEAGKIRANEGKKESCGRRLPQLVKNNL